TRGQTSGQSPATPTMTTDIPRSLSLMTWLWCSFTSETACGSRGSELTGFMLSERPGHVSPSRLLRPLPLLQYRVSCFGIGNRSDRKGSDSPMHYRCSFRRRRAFDFDSDTLSGTLLRPGAFLVFTGIASLLLVASGPHAAGEAEPRPTGEDAV